MNQRQAKKYITDHLYLADSTFVRSASEAAKLASECKVSARTLVYLAQARSSLPTEAWSGFYRALDQADAKQSNTLGTRIQSMTQSLLRHRRAAVAAFLFVLALAFFTLVPAGRAIAKGIFDYVIGVRDGQLEIEQRDEKQLYEERGYDIPETLPPEAAEDLQNGEELQIISDPVYYDSIASFEEKYGLDAFSLDSDSVFCIEVYETDHLFTGKSLRANYQDANGGAINTIEQWYTGDGTSTGSNAEFLQREVLGGKAMQYTIDAVDGSFTGIVLLDNTILTVYADASVDLDFVWQLLS